MARPSKLSILSVEALFKLRDDVAKAIKQKAAVLERQLSVLHGKAPDRGRRSRKGAKVAALFRSRKDPQLTWSGRGVIPRWMKAEMKGTRLTKENFRIK
jgi:DNA-binding protein H-NS